MDTAHTGHSESPTFFFGYCRQCSAQEPHGDPPPQLAGNPARPADRLARAGPAAGVVTMRSFALPALALAFTMTASFGSLLGAWAIGDEGQQKKTPIAQQRQQLMLEKQLQAMKAGHRQ